MTTTGYSMSKTFKDNKYAKDKALDKQRGIKEDSDKDKKLDQAKGFVPFKKAKKK